MGLWGDTLVPAPKRADTQWLSPISEAPRDFVLYVQSSDRDSARQVVERILASTTKKWRFRRTPQNGKGVSLEYHARLRRTYTPEEIRDRVLREGTPNIPSAQWSR